MLAARHSRTAALLGEAAFARLREMRALVVGVGGVGGWCAEALVRSGVTHLTLLDDDRVEESNLNRQDAAVVSMLGANKVEAMKARLLAVDPEAEIESRCERFVTAEAFGDLGAYDVVIDAIDSVNCKAELILATLERGTRLLSSMGAAKRLDPARVRLDRFSKIAGDGLARARRSRLKRVGRCAATDFRAVHSSEPAAGGEGKGSFMPVVATFGQLLAAEAVRAVIRPSVAN